MEICFTKFGNVVDEFHKLENEWKDNSIELIWDVNEISKKHYITAISEDYVENNLYLERKNINLYVVKRISNKIISKLAGNVRFLFRCIRFTYNNKLDYWITTDLKSFLLLNIYCKFKKIELIVNFSHDSQITPINIAIINFFSVKNIIVPGPYLRNTLIDKGIKSNIHARIPRYPEAFFKDIPVQPFDCKFHVLFAARLSKRKGIIEFMDALTDIYKQAPDIGFTIIGDGEEMDTVRQRLKSLPDTNRVRVLGSIPNTAIGTYMRKADVLVFPSHSEGFAKTWIEAIFAEIPMILTPIKSIRSIITNNKHGIYIDFYNYQSIVNAVIFLYLNNDKLAEMKSELRQLKSEFLDKETNNFSQCIFKIIDNNYEKQNN